MAPKTSAVLLLTAVATANGSNVQNSANPIRKVVTMLQNMQKKISDEGAKKEKMFDQYMCYCKNADSTLGQSISDAETKIPQVESSIKESSAMKKQLESDLKDAQVGRVEAKDTIAKATALREKEHKAFSAKKSELDSNIGALSKAIPAIEKGMSGAFLQTQAASVLRQISLSADMIPADRDLLASFLSAGTGYTPQSGQIVGILKTLKDEMEKDLSDATTEENSAQSSFDGLVASKNKEIQALTKQIESKTARIGELGVKIAQMENDLEDTQEGLAEDKKFYADLDKNCELKKQEWAAYKDMQAKEMVALADTIKVLNDDDALELFKKTLPGASSSFMQLQTNKKSIAHHALAALKGTKKDPRLDLIAVAMRGGKMGFEKIIKMIDNLVVELKAEQGIDHDKKNYCEAEFDKAEDKKKGLELDISDLEKAIDDGKESISTLAAEIKALTKGIKDLDKSVAEATETRKEEHDDYVEALAANTAAKDLLAFAKNRLNKFYNPSQYKAPEPAAEAPEFVQVFKHQQHRDAPAAAPATWDGSYKAKGEESSGVIGMIDQLVNDVEKEMQEATLDEKNAQKDYEEMLSDSAHKRAADLQSVASKEKTKAEAETAHAAAVDTKATESKELEATRMYEMSVHADCDWLMQVFDLRKSARAEELDALKNAKAILSGADFSLVQGKARGGRRLRGQ